MKSKIGGSLLMPPTSNSEDIELKVRKFKSAGYDYAELGSRSMKGRNRYM